MHPHPDNTGFEFEHQLDPNKPLVLLLGWVDHEGVLSAIKTSGRQYKKKILNSVPENWSATADLFNQYRISSVIGKLPPQVLALIVQDPYREVGERLFAAIGLVPNQVYLFEDILGGGESAEMIKQFGPYPKREVIEEALAFLKRHNISVIPYSRRAEVTVMADAFLGETDKNLLFRLYVPTGRLWAGEVDRFLQLFQDYLVKVAHLQARLDQRRTEHGVVYEFHGIQRDGQRSIEPEFHEFNNLMVLLQADVREAEALIASKGCNPREVGQIVARYAKEAKRLQLDIKHEAESKVLAIRHRLESELAEANVSFEEWGFVPALLEQAMPRAMGLMMGQEPFHGTLSPLPSAVSRNVTFNFRPQFINTVNGIVAEELNGNQHFAPELHRLLDLVGLHGGQDAKMLATAVYEVADKGVDRVDRLKAKQRLTAFLIEVGKRTGDIAFGVLQKYIETQIGL